MKAPKVYACKAHRYQHPYTVCPACGCQYCARIWESCPRCADRIAYVCNGVHPARRPAPLEKEKAG